MTHTYRLTGMNCSSCETKVTKALQNVKGISQVVVSHRDNTATIDMTEHINTSHLQDALGDAYRIQPKSSCEINEHRPNAQIEFFDWRDKFVWKAASFNTLNCLVGCSIGDFGMVIFLQYFYPNTSMGLQMLLATIAGLITSVTLETTILYYREKLNWGNAFNIAIKMSFLSMVAMEIAMNFTDFMITGGKMLIGDPKYWLAFIPAAFVGFLVPLPYNYFQLKKYNKSCH